MSAKVHPGLAREPMKYENGVSKVYSERQPEYYETFLRRYRPLEGPLLDLGAGYGLLLEHARSKGLEVYGVEIDPFRAKICTDKGLNVIVHDLGKPLTMFQDNFFGVVYLGQVIEHMPYRDHDMVLSEAMRVLKPGGQLQITSPGRYNESEWAPDHCGLLTLSELVSKLEKIGFVEIETKKVNYLQPNKQIPEPLLRYIWETYQPDILSASASAMCRKPRA